MSHRAFLDLIAGRRNGIAASLARGTLWGASLVYGGIMRLRNAALEAGWGVKSLPRPVISVGNLTTGGTGKTPVVRWLCAQLLARGRRPAVLMRGYKARPGQPGDEQAMLEELLARDAAATAASLSTTSPAIAGMLSPMAPRPTVVVEANASRYIGGLAALQRDPAIDVFILDDGFQHRRLRRDFDLVLIDAVNPWGHGYVLPRGLLREPLSGLQRAGAILITRCDQAEPDAIDAILQAVRRHNPTAPTFQCSHVLAGLRSADDQPASLASLADRRFFAFAGIGHPEALERQLSRLPGVFVGHRWFPDHWDYAQDDVETMLDDARAAGADLVLTTEKDWVKIRGWATDQTDPAVARLELTLEFAAEDEQKLLEILRR